jgi:hypothetical protein
MTHTSPPQPVDEETIRDLEVAITNETEHRDNLRRTLQVDDTPPDMADEIAKALRLSEDRLYAARTKHARALAELERRIRLENDAAARRTMKAAEETAAASKDAAKASAAAARWALWVAIFTAIAAIAALIGTWLQVRR